MKKKIFILLVLLSMLPTFSLLEILAAPADPEVIITSGEVKAGDNIHVSVSLSADPKVTTFNFVFMYDPGMLSVASYDWGYSVNGVAVLTKSFTHDEVAGKIYVNFMSLSVLPNVEELIKVVFTAKYVSVGCQTAVGVRYEGTYTGFPVGASVMQYLPAAGSGIITIAVPAQANSVTGDIYSYNPGIPTTVVLLQGGNEKYRITIEATTGSGQVVQTFKFNDVTPGTYDLAITKSTHLGCTITGLIVLPGGVDLTRANDSNIRQIRLPCGDLNGDGYINSSDLSIIVLPGNYNRLPAVYPYQ